MAVAIEGMERAMKERRRRAIAARMSMHPKRRASAGHARRGCAARERRECRGVDCSNGYVRGFNEERPHQGLGQRTPDEVHLARRTSARAGPLRAELVTDLMDGDHALPVLRLRRVA